MRESGPRVCEAFRSRVTACAVALDFRGIPRYNGLDKASRSFTDPRGFCQGNGRPGIQIQRQRARLLQPAGEPIWLRLGEAEIIGVVIE